VKGGGRGLTAAVVRTLPNPSRGCCAALGWWALGSTPPPSGTSLACRQRVGWYRRGRRWHCAARPLRPLGSCVAEGAALSAGKARSPRCGAGGEKALLPSSGRLLSALVAFAGRERRTPHESLPHRWGLL